MRSFSIVHKKTNTLYEGVEFASGWCVLSAASAPVAGASTRDPWHPITFSSLALAEDTLAARAEFDKSGSTTAPEPIPQPPPVPDVITGGLKSE